MEDSKIIKVRDGLLTDDKTYFAVKVRSNFATLLHWILATAVLTLIITGLIIADPPATTDFAKEAYSRYIIGWTRLIHFSAGFIATFAIAARFYLALTPNCSKDIKQFLPTPSNLLGSLKLVLKYLTLKEAEEDHYRFVNPLGGIGVFSMAVAITIMFITGLILYLPGITYGGFFSETFIGTLQTVRLIHHITMYILIFFIVVHVYMQIWKNSMYLDSDLSSIIGGYKLFPKEDLGNFKDLYGERADEQPPSEKEISERSKKVEYGPGNH